VFDARLDPALAANPYLAFYVRAEESGSLNFTWLDDDGSKYTAEQKFTVA
jgi:sulfur-oxidizing protein SoxZ